jgi:NAD(P)-dependent dehydrogenase (short-subunit alcohol dehydrogenase family)
MHPRRNDIVSSGVEEKVIMVTGASSGNGRAIALALAHAGATALILADLTEEPREGGETTAALIARDTAASVRFVKCDITKVAEVNAAVDAAAEFGGLDVLVNNAGVFSASKFLDVSEDQFDFTMAVNVKGAYFASQAAARSMERRGGGSIVNMGSISALAGAADYSLYCTSKGALRLLTQALAAALGPMGIRVNLLCPGLVKTAMTTNDVPIFETLAADKIADLTPLRHVGTTTDIAEAVLYLAGDNSRWVSGSTLVVDGARTSTLPGAFSQAAFAPTAEAAR